MVYCRICFWVLIAAVTATFSQAPEEKRQKPKLVDASISPTLCRASGALPGKTLRTATFVIVDRSTGQRVSGVRQEEVIVLEDGSEREIGAFRETRSPMTAVLVIDTSPSTASLLRQIGQAADTLIGGLSPSDKLSIITFDGVITPVVRTRPVSEMSRQKIRITRTAMGTRLYDAVEFAMTAGLRTAAGRKVVIIFTDGGDTLSERASERSTLAEARESDVMIYSIQYPDRGVGKPSVHWYLRDLAEATGGKVIASADINESTRSLLSILNEAGTQYTLCYWSENATEGPAAVRLKNSGTNLAVRMHTP